MDMNQFTNKVMEALGMAANKAAEDKHSVIDVDHVLMSCLLMAADSIQGF